MLLLANTDKDFSLTLQLHALVVVLPLRQEHIFYMSANDIRNHGIQSLKDILTFPEFNPGAFCFQEGIT